MNSTAIEIFSAAMGIAGCLLLALNGKGAGWGFVAFQASTTGWIVFAWANSHWGFLVQHVFFTATNLLGIWRWLIKPLIDRKLDELFEPGETRT